MAHGEDDCSNPLTGAVLNTYNGKLSIQFTDPVDEADLSSISVNGLSSDDPFFSLADTGYISGAEYIMAADWLEGYFDTTNTITVSQTSLNTHTYINTDTNTYTNTTYSYGSTTNGSTTTYTNYSNTYTYNYSSSTTTTTTTGLFSATTSNGDIIVTETTSSTITDDAVFVADVDGDGSDESWAFEAMTWSAIEVADSGDGVWALVQDGLDNESITNVHGFSHFGGRVVLDQPLDQLDTFVLSSFQMGSAPVYH